MLHNINEKKIHRKAKKNNLNSKSYLNKILNLTLIYTSSTIICVVSHPPLYPTPSAQMKNNLQGVLIRLVDICCTTNSMKHTHKKSV